MALLRTKNLFFKADGQTILDNIDLDLEQGHVYALIGPNGCGKTTLLNIINGQLSPQSGKIELNGENITHLPPEKRYGKGIIRGWQNGKLFRNLTVLENLLVTRSHGGENLAKLFFQYKLVKEQEKHLRHLSEQVLKTIGLEDHEQYLTKALSGGQKKLLNFGQILMQEQVNQGQALLLLDEPFSGVNLMKIHEITELIQKMASKGNTILLVEHNVEEAFELSDQVMVMSKGRVFKEGAPETIKNDPEIMELYLGV